MKSIHDVLNTYIKEYFASKPKLIPNTLAYDDLVIYLQLCFKEDERLSAYVKVYTILVDDVYLHITDYKPFAGLIAYVVEDSYKIGILCKQVEFWNFYTDSFINLYLQDYDFPIFPKENNKEIEIYTIVKRNRFNHSNTEIVRSFRTYEGAENYIVRQNTHDREDKAWDLKCRRETEKIVNLSGIILLHDKIYLDIVLEYIAENISEINIAYMYKLTEMLGSEYLLLDTNLRGGNMNKLDPDACLKTIFEDYVNQYKKENSFTIQHDKSAYIYRIEINILS